MGNTYFEQPTAANPNPVIPTVRSLTDSVGEMLAFHRLAPSVVAGGRAPISPSTAASRLLLNGKAPDSQPGAAQINEAVKGISQSEAGLRLSNLGGQTKGKPNKPSYVIGTGYRLAALQHARSTFNAQLNANPDNAALQQATPSLNAYARGEVRTARDEYQQVQQVLIDQRARQREAQKANAQVLSGRKPRSGAGALLPRTTGLLGEGGKLL